jgi:hypothetical protein
MQIRTDRGWVRAGLAVLVAGVLGGGVLAAACGADDPHRVTSEGVAAGAPAAAQQPLDLAGTPKGEAAAAPKGDPKLGDKVAMGSDGGSVTVSAVEDDVSAGRLFGPGKGFKYVAAEVKGCSGPHEKGLSFEPGYFLLRLDDGTMRDHGPGAKKPELDGGAVPAGGCLAGWVTFTVPDGALPTGVVYDGSTRTTWTVPIPKGAKPTTTTMMRAGSTTPSSGKAAATTSTTTKPKTTTTTAAGTTAKPAGSSTTTTGKMATTTTGKMATTTTTGSATTSTTSAQE